MLTNDNIDFIFYNHQNPDQTIIFLPGFWATYNINSQVALKLTKYDYYGVNLPGHGKSFIDHDPLTIYTLTNSILNFFKKKNFYNIILIAHSMSGAIAMLLSKLAPKLFAKIIYVTPMNPYSLKEIEKLKKYFFAENIDDYVCLIKKLYVNANKMISNPHYYQGMKNNLNKRLEDQTMWKLFNSFIEQKEKLINDLTKCLNDNIVPSTLILGKSDGFIDFEPTLNFFKNNAQNFNYEILKEQAHLPFHEDPENFVIILERIINKNN